jgi:hypothetical protein
MGPAGRRSGSGANPGFGKAAPVAAFSAPINNKNLQFLLLIPLHPLVRHVDYLSVFRLNLLVFSIAQFYVFCFAEC